MYSFEIKNQIRYTMFYCKTQSAIIFLVKTTSTPDENFTTNYLQCFLFQFWNIRRGAGRFAGKLLLKLKKKLIKIILYISISEQLLNNDF